METVSDIFAFLKSVFVSAGDLVVKATDVVIVEEPFLQGVQATVAVMLVIKYREALSDFIAKIPLVGSGAAWVVRKGEALMMNLYGKARDLVKKGYDATLGRLWSAIMRKDKQIKED